MAETLVKTFCYHCGEVCDTGSISFDEKKFCCPGCKLVFELIVDNDLCSYYDLNKRPGNKVTHHSDEKFKFLDEKSVAQKLLAHKNGDQESVFFSIPAMHCSSCIWLLENLNKIESGVKESKVDFIRKEIFITYDSKIISLRRLVELLSSTGYEPEIHADNKINESKKKKSNRVLRIGIAGFCFGNIMMLSFPEYFSSGDIKEPLLKAFFSYLILLLSVPVFFFSASEFFIGSYRAIKYKTTNIDIPIAIGLIAIFSRSCYEILSGTGAGFLDSGTGLIFFMLIGRWFQDHTFDFLSFERDYRSYFPIAVTIIENGIEKSISVDELNVNDRILIRNNEIVPVDSVLISGEALIDYSFVTGESSPTLINKGETIFAGGKQTGTIIGLKIIKKVSQSRLVSLWNNGNKKYKINQFEKLVGNISKYFIATTLTIACIAALYWWDTDHHKAINAFTSVLVIACPCALALSAPFTYGNVLRILGKKKIYLRNFEVAERIADVDTIVFDKTGTLTTTGNSEIHFEGTPLHQEERIVLFSLIKNSIHPLSRQLSQYLNEKKYFQAHDLKEYPGKGISGIVCNRHVRIGSLNFVSFNAHQQKKNKTAVHVSIDNKYYGCFTFKNIYRTNLDKLISQLHRDHKSMKVLSGDSDAEYEELAKIFPVSTELKFNCSPADKQEEIISLKNENRNVMMVGDGLNDAGALISADVGVSLTENVNNFCPASDIIMHSEQFSSLPKLIRFMKIAKRIIIVSFIISLLYNFIGLYFAVSGTLSPLIAAILMPISTISLVLFTVFSSTITSRRLGL